MNPLNPRTVMQLSNPNGRVIRAGLLRVAVIAAVLAVGIGDRKLRRTGEHLVKQHVPERAVSTRWIAAALLLVPT